MRIAYQYKFRPNRRQQEVIDSTLKLLRRQYNYRLAERFLKQQQNRCAVNSCPLIRHFLNLSEHRDDYSQKANLINTKELFSEYKDIHSQVLQDCIKRVQITTKRWLKGDSQGKRSLKPRFKGKGRYRLFIFSQVKQVCIQKINFTTIDQWNRFGVH